VVGLAAASVAALAPAAPGSRVGELTRERAAEIAAGAEGSVWSVSAEGCGGRVAGTGFEVGGRLVTNRHLVVGADRVDVGGNAPGRSYSLVQWVVDGDRDLAGAQVGELGGLELASVRAPVGAGVVMVGRPGGGLEWAKGRVHLYTTGGPYGTSGEVMLVDPAPGPGFSGAPVLDREGRVVGVLRAMDVVTGLGVAVPVAEVAMWLGSEMKGSASTDCMDLS
jgi:S1-C subfamily serine protease